MINPFFFVIRPFTEVFVDTKGELLHVGLMMDVIGQLHVQMMDSESESESLVSKYIWPGNLFCGAL